MLLLSVVSAIQSVVVPAVMQQGSRAFDTFGACKQNSTNVPAHDVNNPCNHQSVWPLSAEKRHCL